jgi:cytochrome b involved in lipid metabolism
VAGGVHGENRLGGSSLLDCVVYGRVAAASAMAYSLKAGFVPYFGSPHEILNAPAGAKTGEPSDDEEDDEEVEEKATAAGSAGESMGIQTASLKEISAAEVAKHNKPNEMWVSINGLVLNVTEFLDSHPGGRPAITLYAGRDATPEFNMVHPKGVVKKFAPWTVIGKLKA